MAYFSSKAGKGMSPMKGVNWRKQFENNPFLSPLEKRLLKEELDREMRESDAEWAKRKLSDERMDYMESQGM